MNDVLFAALLDYSDLVLLLLRIWLAILFGWSGWSHVTKPRERANSIGMSPGATFVVGAVEVLASVLLVIGLWDQAAAAALSIVMLGALYKKMLVWKTGFWGGPSMGWYYEVLYILCNLVIVTTGGGSIGIA